MIRNKLRNMDNKPRKSNKYLRAVTKRANESNRWMGGELGGRHWNKVIPWSLKHTHTHTIKF